MIRKEDLKEIETSIKEDTKKDLENYNMLKNKKEKEKIYSKRNKTIKIILITIIVLFCMWLLFKLCIALSIPFGNLKNRYNANLIETIESSYNIKVKIVSQNFDEYENGECTLKLKKFPKIEFKASKKWGNLKDDYDSRLHKYLFENWNNNEKDKFTVIENITEDGFLQYETYIEINTLEECEEATNTLIKFLEYADNWNKQYKKVINIPWQKEGQFIYPLSKIYLVKATNRITPYHGCYQTADEIRKEARKMYSELENN